MGKAHRANLRAGKVKGLQLTAICDQPAGLPAKEEGEHQFSDFQEMIASGTIDAVLIATPHFFHTTMGRLKSSLDTVAQVHRLVRLGGMPAPRWLEAAEK